MWDVIAVIREAARALEGRELQDFYKEINFRFRHEAVVRSAEEGKVEVRFDRR